jgi:hypothetical protein
MKDTGFHEKWYSYPVNHAGCHKNFAVVVQYPAPFFYISA